MCRVDKIFITNYADYLVSFYGKAAILLHFYKQKQTMRKPPEPLIYLKIL